LWFLLGVPFKMNFLFNFHWGSCCMKFCRFLSTCLFEMIFFSVLTQKLVAKKNLSFRLAPKNPKEYHQSHFSSKNLQHFHLLQTYLLKFTMISSSFGQPTKAHQNFIFPQKPNYFHLLYPPKDSTKFHLWHACWWKVH